MAVYVIGDVQGCYRELKMLLKSVGYKSDKDKLWFAGDLVNRGPDSLKTLRFVKSLGEQAVTVLGNHDLHLLSAFYSGERLKSSDTLQEVLAATDANDLMEWLKNRPLMHHDINLNFSMVHAGIYPGWSISDALKRAQEVESVLQGKNPLQFLKEMYGNSPDLWADNLQGMDRLRFIVNVFTRMRFLQSNLTLDLMAKGTPDKLKNNGVKPWFEFKPSSIKLNRVAFGHWSTLASSQYGNCFALDSGCIWGGRLTALRIDKKIPRWFSLSCSNYLTDSF